MIGEQAGSYIIRQYLGGGATGDVYLATDGSGHLPVAIKILKQHAASQRSTVVRFQRAAAAARRVRHPNLIQVYGDGILPDGRPFLIMEHLSGGSLGDLLRRRKQLPAGEALGLLREIALGVAAAHAAGIVHRDLKPENVIFRQTGEPVVVDLNIAAVAQAEGLTRRGDTLGTLEYMAPEQFSRAHEVDGRADVYALGAILFEMLAGRPPVMADNPWAIVHAKINMAAPSLRRFRSDVSDNIERVVATCLQRDPAGRYATAQALLAAIDLCLSNPRIIGRPPSIIRRLLLAVLLMVPVAVFVLLFVAGGDTPLVVAVFGGSQTASPPTIVRPPSRSPTVTEAHDSRDRGEPETLTDAGTSTLIPPAATAVTPVVTLPPPIAVGDVVVPVTVSPTQMPLLIAPAVTAVTPLSAVPEPALLTLTCDQTNSFQVRQTITFGWAWAGALDRSVQVEVRVNPGPNWPVPVTARRSNNIWSFSQPAGFHSGEGRNYTWRVYVLDENGNVLASSDRGCFRVEGDSPEPGAGTGPTPTDTPELPLPPPPPPITITPTAPYPGGDPYP